jgi:hypothetical protein
MCTRGRIGAATPTEGIRSVMLEPDPPGSAMMTNSS